jgi:predicted TIM-barrel fold metal-dependent hydrolase
MQGNGTAERPFVIDGVAHAYDFSPNNRIEASAPERNERFAHFAYKLGHIAVESLEPGYALSLNEFTSRWFAEDLAHAFFVESDVDMVVHHHVEISSYWREGAARYDTGLALRDAAPDRVLLYGCVDTFGDMNKALESMHRMAEDKVSGFKFYPSNGFYDVNANALKVMFYDSPDKAFRYFETAAKLGIRHLAFHKAQPIGPGPMSQVSVEDISTAASAFPDLSFEIVHDGWAFLEESAVQLLLHANVYANLECVVNLIVRQPLKFAHILGTLIQYGGPDRILFATGCAVNHADPILQAFLKFEMPQELIDGYGYEPLTDEVKRKILGENMAGLLGVDIGGVKKKIQGDKWSKLRAEGKAKPWSAHRQRLARPDYPADYRGY